MFARTANILNAAGHEVWNFERFNSEVIGVLGLLSASFSGLYSLGARNEFASLLDHLHPDVVHVHSFLPLISSSVFDACRERQIPAFLRLADFSLLCPAAHHFRNGIVCENCLGGREFQCVVNKCRGGVLRSSAYAARTFVIRKRGYLLDLVQRFIAPSHFVKQKHLDAGIPGTKISVLYNPVPIPELPSVPADGDYIAYIGRVSEEKGISVLMQAAQRCGLPIAIAGGCSPGPMCDMQIPKNVTFVGKLASKALEQFYRGARMVVVPSICLESFGLSCAEGMAYAIPIIASRVGALPELLEGGECGLLVEPGCATELASAMADLWNHPGEGKRIGMKAREKASSDFSPSSYCTNLLSLYSQSLNR